MFQGFITSTTALLASAFASATGALTNLVGGAASDSATQTSLISENPVGPVEDSGRANGHSPLHRDVFIPARSSTSRYAPISGSPRPSGPRDDIFSSGQRMAPAFGLPLFAPLSVVLWSGAFGKVWKSITQTPSDKIHELARSITEQDLGQDTPPRTLTKLLSYLKSQDQSAQFIAAEAILDLPWENGNPHLLSRDEWLGVARPFYSDILRERTTYPDSHSVLRILAPSSRLIRLLTILFERNHADARTILYHIISFGDSNAFAPAIGLALLDRIVSRQESLTLQWLYVEILQVAFFGPGTHDTQRIARLGMDVWKRKIFLNDPHFTTHLHWHAFRYLVFREGDSVEEKLGLLATINKLSDFDLNDFLYENRVSSRKEGVKDPLLALVRLASLDWIASITAADTVIPLPKDEADGLVRLLAVSGSVREFFETLPPSTYRGTVQDSWEILKALLERDDLAYRETAYAHREVSLLNAAISVARRVTEDAKRREAEEFLFEKISGFFERHYSTLSTAQILAVWVPAIIFFANSPTQLGWLHEPSFIERVWRMAGEERTLDPSLMRALMILAQYEDRPEFAVYDLPKSAQALLREFDAAYDPAVWVEGSFRGTRWEDRVELGAYDFVALGGGQVMVRDEPGEPVDMGGEHVVVGSASDYARTERE